MTDTQDARALVERLTGFTRGQWAYRPEKYDYWGMVRGADKYPVASASTCRSDDFEKNEHRRNKTDPADANARLIAAAPDLHAALRAALDRAEKAEAELHKAHASGYAQGVRHVADRLRIMGNMGGQAIALALLTADTPAPSQENSHD